MGACVGNPRTSIENMIDEIWSDSDLTKITPESYFNFFKRFIESSRNLLNINDQDDQIYSIIFSAPNFKEFFFNLKNDLISLANNGKLHFVMLGLIFFTNSKDHINLAKYLDKLFSFVKYYFNIEDDIQTDKEFFIEILDIYILINSQLSLNNVMKYGNLNLLENKIKNEEEILIKCYDKSNRDLLRKKLISDDEFFYMNKFINDNFEKLIPINIRDQLRDLYFENVNK
jgi:hypothetical protein